MVEMTMADQTAFNPADIPVVILCGGEGTRLREATERMPKPLVEIGSEPILLHIMRIYARQGFKNFILCLGYRGVMIKEAFLQYEMRRRDMLVDFAKGQHSFLGEEPDMDWRITMAETGASTQTGGRVARIAPYVKADRFMLTYGDGVSDIDLHKAMAFHLAHGRIGTVTGVQPASQFGVMRVEGDTVTAFAEKPKSTALINGGFFIFERSFFDYLSEAEDCILERRPLERLAGDGQLKVYEHTGFWRCMDTFKDYRELNDAWAAGDMPWVPGSSPEAAGKAAR
jgi:glucose-1-phosphate cytidylyltransferase